MATMADFLPGDKPNPEDWFAQFEGGPIYEQGGITGGGNLPGVGNVQAQPMAGTQGDAGKDAFGRMWTGSGGRTVEDLKNFVAQHPEFGVTLGGSKGDNVYGPGGQFWADAVIAAGEGGRGASWQTDTGGGAGGGNAMGNFTFSPDDPSYQWRLGQGLKASEGSAAARGTLLTGGHQKDLQDYAQGLASTEYANQFQRKYNLAGLGLDATARAAGLGLDAAHTAAGLGSSYGTNVANLYGSQGNANAANSVAQGNLNANTIGSLGNIGGDVLGDLMRKRRQSGYDGSIYGPGY